ncbi:MAG: 3-hydroxybutyryl-CoA dehydrogenase [Clostridiales bacterium]|nr:3-hydroxybutyryl-CoA dehydrogenase [Clostridiales bacterium]
MQKMVVIGLGTMGSGIVQTGLMAGFQVMAMDSDPEKAEKTTATISKALTKLVEKGKMEQSAMDNAMGRLSVTSDLKRAADADFVIEASVEDIEVKKTLFQELDRICKPETILASNTSSLSITDIASVTKRPEKVIGMHFFNPAPTIKLLEVVVGHVTSNDTYDTVCAVGEKMGKTIVTSQDKAGFIVNRLVIPFINEAVFLLEEGVGTREDIDHGSKLGLNHPMGPLELADLIGLDVMVAIMDALYDELKDSKYRCAPLMRRMVRAGHLGRKTGKGFYTYEI